MTDERAFVENWWRRKFSMPNTPTDDDVIMFAHAIELLTAYQMSDDKWMPEATTKYWLDGWWRPKFEGSPPKHGSVLSLAGAEELLIDFRKFAEFESRKSKKGKNPRKSVKSRFRATEGPDRDTKAARDIQTDR